MEENAAPADQGHLIEPAGAAAQQNENSGNVPLSERIAKERQRLIARGEIRRPGRKPRVLALEAARADVGRSDRPPATFLELFCSRHQEDEWDGENDNRPLSERIREYRLSQGLDEASQNLLQDSAPDPVAEHDESDETSAANLFPLKKRFDH